MRRGIPLFFVSALTLGIAGLGCDVQEDNTDAPRDNAAGRTDGDGAPSISGSESTGATDNTQRTMPGGNTIRTD
ncbi:MAG TPA: hypothetical protein VGN72_14120 [Tepidisphaeraceae bacterium]|nr:hypothetical protein [Tepidisphaeraceae bacterium]